MISRGLEAFIDRNIFLGVVPLKAQAHIVRINAHYYVKCGMWHVTFDRFVPFDLGHVMIYVGICEFTNE
jgi:hypothetical protein